MPPIAVNAAPLCGKCADLLGMNPCSYTVTCDACNELWRPQTMRAGEWHTARNLNTMPPAQNPNAMPHYNLPQYSNNRTPRSDPNLWTTLPLAPHPNKEKQAPAPRRQPTRRLPLVASPEQTSVPLVNTNRPADPSEPIQFQTLALLLKALNHLLCNPHPPFDFWATYSIVAEPTIIHAARVNSVAWELIRGTMLAFNIHNLEVQPSPNSAAFAVSESAGIWMGAPPDPRLADVSAPRPCEHCEHVLTIGVESDDSALSRGVQGQRIFVRPAARHCPLSTFFMLMTAQSANIIVDSTDSLSFNDPIILQRQTSFTKKIVIRDKVFGGRNREAASNVAGHRYISEREKN
ncbi:hypothetical protein DFH09DRAFT_1426112 [Mycena vulgaris]|nr:hypothetical protein DFH09DRAFT_1426112 [Mycena vulgaris]